MSEDVPTLQEVARRYLESLKDEIRLAHQAEVQRFVRWCGADRPFAELRGQEIANYGQTLTGTVTGASQRADAIRKFFVFAKKAQFSPTNLGSHLRLPKGAAKKAASGPVPKEEQLSEEVKAALVADLEALKAQRPQILQDIQRAREDKDFKENAPLDAARQQQAFVEGRIQELETRLAHAVVVQPGARATKASDVIEIGSTVVVINLKSGAEVTYTLVRPSEVNPAQGRISIESPVGQAFLQRSPGDEVQVAAPSGTLTFRIERVEA
jgi:transcription elongation factor GreA